jgi:hypothetical protein
MSNNSPFVYQQNNAFFPEHCLESHPSRRFTKEMHVKEVHWLEI